MGLYNLYYSWYLQRPLWINRKSTFIFLLREIATFITRYRFLGLLVELRMNDFSSVSAPDSIMSTASVLIMQKFYNYIPICDINVLFLGYWSNQVRTTYVLIAWSLLYFQQIEFCEFYYFKHHQLASCQILHRRLIIYNISGAILVRLDSSTIHLRLLEFAIFSSKIIVFPQNAYYLYQFIWHFRLSRHLSSTLKLHWRLSKYPNFYAF